MANIKLKVSEVKSFIEHIIKNNQELQKNGKKTVSLAVEGDSGLGKTSLVLQVAKDLGLNFVKLNLAQIEELGD